MRHGIALLLLTAGTLLAEHRVQLTWEGTIDSPTTLRIHGDRVESNISGTYTQPSFRFNSPLPRVNQTVEMTVNQGRGRVRIVEQPRAANDYTLVVAIDPRNRARDFYSIDFAWEGSDTAYDRGDNRRGRRDDYGTRGRRDDYGTRSRAADREGSGSVTWSGYVDNEVFVSFRNRRAFSTAVRGRNVGNEQFEFHGALPRREVIAHIEDVEGRGRVELMEQPNARNGYAAKVRIVDSDTGGSLYRFTLAWDDAGLGRQQTELGRQQSGSVLSPYPTEQSVVTPGANYGFDGMRWSARVDGHVRVVVDNNRVYSQRISGGPLANEQASFSGRAMGRASGDISIRKLRGRDNVEIVERPTAANGYRLVFEIHDDDGGADDYEVEIRW